MIAQPDFATAWQEEIEDISEPVDSLGYSANDLGNAARFVDYTCDRLRYVPEWESWLVWSEHLWRRDTDGAVYREAEKHAADLLRASAEILDIDARQRSAKLALNLGKRATIENLLALARYNARVIVHADKLDANPWLLCVGNGVVDLRTGKFRSGAPLDFITKKTGREYIPDAECPQFDAFLLKIMNGNREMVAYLWRIIGYLITGLDVEQCLFFFYGAGRNGKGTLIEILAALLGEYAAATVVELITENRHGREPSQLVAALKGLRMAHLPETEDGHIIAQARLKTLTGGDTLVGRNLYEKEFSFKNSAKLLIHGNSRPEIRGIDLGIWRRFRLIPFEVTIQPHEIDFDLGDKLRTELPGILNRAITGCLDWQRNKMRTPQLVEKATADYREAEDVLGEFLAERTEASLTADVVKGDLYQNYAEWCETRTQRPFSAKRFASLIAQRGFRERRTNSTRLWIGLKIK